MRSRGEWENGINKIISRQEELRFRICAMGRQVRQTNGSSHPHLSVPDFCASCESILLEAQNIRRKSENENMEEVCKRNG